MASLQASYAIIEGVDWVQICTCSISYCRLLLPVKILVTKLPFDSTLESATATFGRQFKQRIAGQPELWCWLTKFAWLVSIAVNASATSSTSASRGLTVTTMDLRLPL